MKKFSLPVLPSRSLLAFGTAASKIWQKGTTQPTSDMRPPFPIPVINNGDRFAEQKFKLCYFESGRLLSADVFPMAFQYLAISHAWGQPKWQHIPGIEGQVLASESKAKFIAQRLPGLVGADYFWMDILCVDQKDKGARVAVTQYIPQIFRHAQRTIFVKDDVGI